MADVTPILSFIQSLFPDNTTGLIDASDVRQGFTAIGSLLAAVAPGAGAFTLSATAGNTITDARLAGRTVALVTINDASKNQGFTKQADSSTLTFTDGTLLANGDTVTIIVQ